MAVGDVIDHPPSQHDDVANVVAGACVLAATQSEAGGRVSWAQRPPRRIECDLGPPPFWREPS